VSRIGVVVLAAGRSTRFASGASSKLLASVRGAPLVRHAVTAAVDADVGEVVVVTGDRSDDVASSLAGIRARIVREPRFADGMATSLVRGVLELRTVDAIMVALGDMPGVVPEAYRRIVARCFSWVSSMNSRMEIPRCSAATSLVEPWSSVPQTNSTFCRPITIPIQRA